MTMMAGLFEGERRERHAARLREDPVMAMRDAEVRVALAELEALLADVTPRGPSLTVGDLLNIRRDAMHRLPLVGRPPRVLHWCSS